MSDDGRISAIEEQVYQALQLGHRMTVDEWAESEDGLYLSERNSAIPGRVDFNLTPYMRFPLRLFTDPMVDRIGGCWGTQSGKTTVMWACLGYVIDQDPGPAMMMVPTEAFGKSVSKDRLQPLILDCPSLRRHMTGRADDFGLLSYAFDRMTVRFAFAESAVSVRSHPVRYLFKDESSAVDAATWAEADSRTKTYWNRKILEFSTPRLVQDSIWSYLGLKVRENVKGVTLSSQDYEAKSLTSVYFHYVPCPHCGHFQRLEFTGIRWNPDSAVRDLDGQGWYECENPRCKGKITDADKPAMLAKGEWRSDNPGGRWVGLHLNSLYAPWDSCRFGVIAAAYLRAKMSGDPDQEATFIRDYLALPYNHEAAGTVLVDETAIEKRHQAYLRNQVPAPVKVLIVGADVREMQVHWVVQGWGANSESWRIAWGILPDIPAFEDWARSAQWVHATDGPMSLTAGGIDSRYKSHEVIEMCKRLRFMRAIRGEDEIVDPRKRTPVPWRTIILDRDARGKPIVGGMQGYRVNTMFFKEMLYQRINRTDEKTPDLWHLPADRDEVYERHLQSEHEIIERERGSGKLRKKWVVRKGFDANHYLDCEVYGMAIAHAYKLFYLQADAPVLMGYLTPRKAEAPGAPKEPVRGAFVDPGRLRI